MSKTKLDAAKCEYLAECDELAQRVCLHLQAIEKGNCSPEIIDSLYRDIHTIKGASQLFGYSTVSELTHALETGLEPVRKNKLVPTPSQVEVLFQGLDLIERLLNEIRQDTPHAEETVTEVAKAIFQTIEPIDQQSDVKPVSDENVEGPPVQNNTPEHNVAASPAESNDASTIRVSVSLLDRLMTLMGEMVLVRNQVIQFANQSDHLEFLNLSQRLDVVTSEIQSEVMKTRMQPIGNILTKFNRVVRDLSRDLGKKIELALSGVETELDKTLLEAVKDPIMHIVRNSCDHGIETVEERRQAGKPTTGTVSIRSYHEGGQVIVEISDDGKGLQKEKILKKAIEKGLLTPEKAKSLSERDIFGLIFAPGFSTASHITNVSGRGVGMDVVKNNIEGIGGLVEVLSQVGKGTTTRLKIPLTLAIVPAMIVRSQGERFAIPQVKLIELVRVERSSGGPTIEKLYGKSVCRLRGNILPLVLLNDVLGRNGERTIENEEVVNIVVLNADGLLFGLVVDEVLDTAEVVVKPLSNFLKNLNVYSGATVLGDGGVALILDVMGITLQQKLNLDGRAASLQAVNDDAAVKNEMQEFLLFRLNSSSKHAIPLNLVHRLEEFKAGSIEYSGAQRLVRYRNSVLPIVTLNEYLGYGTTEMAKSDESISVIVSQKGGRLFGIEVDEILDVLCTTDSMDDGFTDRVGLLGNLATIEEIVVVVDALRILDDALEKLSKGVPAKAPKPVGEINGRTTRILLVEDTMFFRKHVGNVLSRSGFELMFAGDGAEALRILESEGDAIDLVLSDIEMPTMNGIEFIKAMRKIERFKSMPAIALTTKFDEHHIAEGKKAGFDEYLEKLNPEKLLAEIGASLRRSPMQGKAS